MKINEGNSSWSQEGLRFSSLNEEKVSSYAGKNEFCVALRMPQVQPYSVLIFNTSYLDDSSNTDTVVGDNATAKWRIRNETEKNSISSYECFFFSRKLGFKLCYIKDEYIVTDVDNRHNYHDYWNDLAIFLGNFDPKYLKVLKAATEDQIQQYLRQNESFPITDLLNRKLLALKVKHMATYSTEEIVNSSQNGKLNGENLMTPILPDPNCDTYDEIKVVLIVCLCMLFLFTKFKLLCRWWWSARNYLEQELKRFVKSHFLASFRAR